MLRNNLLVFIGETDKASGAGQILVEGIKLISDNMELIARTAIAAGTALAVNFVQKGVRAAIAGLAQLAVAIATNPITALPALVTGAIAALVGFGDKIKVQADGITTLADVAIETWNTMKQVFQTGFDVIADIAREFFGDSFELNSETWQRVRLKRSTQSQERSWAHTTQWC